MSRHIIPTRRRPWLGIALTGAVLVLAVFAAVAATTQGSGQRASEVRPLGDFEAIELAGPIKLTVRQAATPSVRVEADDNLLPLIETEVVGRGSRPTLRVRVRPGEHLRHRGSIVVTAEVVRLSSIASAGSGDIEVGTLNTPALKLSLAGSSDADLTGLTTERFEISIAGSGDIRARGQARELELGIAGSGDADLDGLSADAVRVRIAGSGDASVVANRSLTVSIAGSGDVRYRGSVAEVKSSVVGSGSVRRR